MHGLSPAWDAPAVLSADLPLLQIGKLPQMVYSVQIANLYKPRTHALHDFSASLEAPAPVRLPLEEIAGLKLVRPQLKKPAQLPRRCSGPEAELLHQGRLFLVNQGTQLAVKFRKIGVLRNCVQRAMVTFVALVLPDMNYKCLLGLQVMWEVH